MNRIFEEIHETIPLGFKTERQRRELGSRRVRSGLLLVVAFASLWAFRRYGLFPEVTEVFRTEDEQRAIYPDDPLRKSVHQFWRGCDMVMRGLGGAEHAHLRDVVNYFFPYGKAGHRTCVYHDAGTGPHLHLQVRD